LQNVSDGRDIKKKSAVYLRPKPVCKANGKAQVEARRKIELDDMKGRITLDTISIDVFKLGECRQIRLSDLFVL
jgi:hypothetical protein